MKMILKGRNHEDIRKWIDWLKRIAFDMVHLHTLKAEIIETNERAINFYKKIMTHGVGRI